MMLNDGVVMGSEADLLMIDHGVVRAWAVKHIHKKDAARSPHVTTFQRP